MIEIINRFAQVRACAFVPEESAFEVKLVSFEIRCRANSDSLPFRASQLCFESVSDCFRDISFDYKDVSQLPVVGFGPEMRIGLRVNQLHADPDLVGRFLHATFKNISYAKLLRDLGNIARCALITLRGSARNYFQIRDAGQSRQDLFLNAIGEVGVSGIETEVFERKHCDTLWDYEPGFMVPERHTQANCKGDQQRH